MISTESDTFGEDQHAEANPDVEENPNIEEDLNAEYESRI